MGKYKAVIFDMDGTLLDTLEDISDSVNYALAGFGFPLRDISEIRNYVGNGVIRMMELSVPNGLQKPRFNDAVSLFREHYSQNCMNKTHPYAGVMDLLKALTKRDYGMAVISNKYDAAVQELNSCYFSKYINVAIGEKEGIAKKPSADMLLEALERLGITSGEAVYVGDSEVDIETAKNAGVDCISVTWGFRDRDWLIGHGAGIIIDYPEEILSLL